MTPRRRSEFYERSWWDIPQEWNVQIAFYTDQNGDHWFYPALTDRVLRYGYVTGEAAPSSEPEVIATFPDYVLTYKYCQ